MQFLEILLQKQLKKKNQIMKKPKRILAFPFHSRNVLGGYEKIKAFPHPGELV